MDTRHPRHGPTDPEESESPLAPPPRRGGWASNPAMLVVAVIAGAAFVLTLILLAVR